MGRKTPPARRQPKPKARQPHLRPKARSAPLPAPAEPGSAQQVKLTAEQTLGVQLMITRDAIKQKNTFIAQSQLSRSAAAQADAQRIKDLERELGDQTNQLMGALNRAEDAENALLRERLNLPTGTTNYKIGEDGLFYYEVGAGTLPQAPQVAKPPTVLPPLSEEGEEEDEEEEEETPAERRTRLKQELAELGEDEDEVKAPEVPEKETSSA